MGVSANRYRLRKIHGRSGAIDEFDYYHEDEKLLYPRPCFCEWSHLQDRLLGRPPQEGHACACSGMVPFNVPGYVGPWGQGDECVMRRFCETQLREGSAYV